MHSRQSEGQNPPNVGRCTIERCPQNCYLSRVAQDTAKSRFLAHDEPGMRFGGGKMGQNGPRHAPWKAPGRVSDGPKCSISTPFVTTSALGLPGTNHKWLWHHFGSFWGTFGPLQTPEDQFGPFRVGIPKVPPCGPRGITGVGWRQNCPMLRGFDAAFVGCPYLPSECWHRWRTFLALLDLSQDRVGGLPPTASLGR